MSVIDSIHLIFQVSNCLLYTRFMNQLNIDLIEYNYLCQLVKILFGKLDNRQPFYLCGHHNIQYYNPELHCHCASLIQEI